MKHYFLLGAIVALMTTACTQNSNELKIERRMVSIPNEGAGKELIAQLLKATDEGNSHCYHDTLLQDAFAGNIYSDEALVSKEVIQIPDALAPGEYLDTVVVTEATASSFSRMVLCADFNDGKLHSIAQIRLLIPLVFEGMDLGELWVVNVDPKAVAGEGGFIQRASHIIESEGLELLSRHAWEKRRMAGNMDGSL